MRLAGEAAVLIGADDLPDQLERKPAFTPQEIDAYAAELREQNRLSEIEREYDLIVLLRREVRGDPYNLKLRTQRSPKRRSRTPLS